MIVAVFVAVIRGTTQGKRNGKAGVTWIGAVGVPDRWNEQPPEHIPVSLQGQWESAGRSALSFQGHKWDLTRLALFGRVWASRSGR